MGTMRSGEITHEIEELEGELTTLRARLDEDDSSFSSLERQIGELRDRLTETRDSVRKQELRLAEKQVELAEAKRLERLEAYDRDLNEYREARTRVAGAARSFLEELDAYDGDVVRLRQLLEEMGEAFGAGDARVGELETALKEEQDELNGWWKAVVGATKWRLVESPDGDEVTVVESDSDLARDLQERTEEKRVSRIMDYFGKNSPD
jgi:chromosome segregation ATPase